MNKALFNAHGTSKSPKCEAYDHMMAEELVESWVNGNRRGVLSFFRVTAGHSPILALLYQAEFIILLATAIDGADNVRAFLDRVAVAVDIEADDHDLGKGRQA